MTPFTWRKAGSPGSDEHHARTPATGVTGRLPVTTRLLHLALPLLGIVLALLLWWLATSVLAPPSSFLARFSPDRTFRALVRLVSTGQMWPHLLVSFQRVLVGLTISIVIGFPLGLAAGSLPAFARLTGPVFQFIRMVSPLAWTPLAIILLGVGNAPVYFLIAIGGIWPIALNTSAGVAALDPRWVRVARSLGANRWEIACTVVWPSIRPHALTGIRLAVGLAWIILVPAEMLGVDSGLGYFVLNTRDRLAYSELMAAILVIGACGFLLDAAARWLFTERRPSRRAPAAIPAGAPAEAPAVPSAGAPAEARLAAAAGSDGRIATLRSTQQHGKEQAAWHSTARVIPEAAPPAATPPLASDSSAPAG